MQSGQSFVSRDGDFVELKTSELDKFVGRLRGRLLRPNEPEYDQARQVWNGMIDRRPGAILRCAGVADVLRGLELARERNLRLAIRGGGHNIAGHALCDGGLVLDLSGMRSVLVDAADRRAHIEPGALLADVDHETQAFALATPLGINSTTGLAGLTLGGGFGWLSRRYGLTADNLRSADVVLADGRMVRASEDEYSDLFWALRGGGGNYGIVTRFELELHPFGPEVLAGLFVFPLAQGREVLARYRALAARLPEDVSVWAVLRKAPPLPFLPTTMHGQEVVILALFGGEAVGAAEAAMHEIRRMGSLAGEHVGTQPYTAWQRTFDPLLTHGARNYWKSHNFQALDDGLLDTLLDYAGRLPSPETEIFIGQLGGVVKRIASDATAYAHRDIDFVMNVHGRWRAQADDARCVGWARDFFNAAAPYATGGVYVNFLTEDESSRLSQAYGPNYARLGELKRRFDPDNVFASNPNIKPSAPEKTRRPRAEPPTLH